MELWDVPFDTNTNHINIAFDSDHSFQFVGFKLNYWFKSSSYDYAVVTDALDLIRDQQLAIIKFVSVLRQHTEIITNLDSKTSKRMAHGSCPTEFAVYTKTLSALLVSVTGAVRRVLNFPFQVSSLSTRLCLRKCIYKLNWQKNCHKVWLKTGPSMSILTFNLI